MTDSTQYAVIHVKAGTTGDAWPIVERVPGGWQSGAHHYPDAEVLSMRALHLVDVEAVNRWRDVEQRARELAGFDPSLVDTVNFILTGEDN